MMEKKMETTIQSLGFGVSEMIRLGKETLWFEGLGLVDDKTGVRNRNEVTIIWVYRAKVLSYQLYGIWFIGLQGMDI